MDKFPEFPKLVKGTCSICKKEGSDFQTSFSKIICGDCKVEIGERIQLAFFKALWKRRRSE